VIPINDSQRNRYMPFPYMTAALIAINTLVLLWLELYAQRVDEAALMNFFQLYGSVPRLIFAREGGGALASLTSTFLHAGWLHLGGNMLALWVFGRRVEDACGPWRFLVFYLACGVGADMLSTLVRSGSTVFGIGASGAVYGVMGAYLLLYPTGRIRSVVFVLGLAAAPQIRAIWVVLFFVVTQIFSAFFALQGGIDYGVNYWAHLGGFFCCLLIFLFVRPEEFYRYVNDAPEIN
jgi:membrane associated rhomboid family serine protease